MEHTVHGTDCVYLDDLRLDLVRGVLERHGQPVTIRPKVYALLSYMALHTDRVIGKEELLQQVWGKLALSDDVLTQSVKELRRIIGDSEGRILQTFSRRGYLLKPSPPPRPHGQLGPRQPEFFDEDEPASDRQTSVAVLVFDNLSDPADDDGFAAGLAEDIAIGLSRFRWLLVIARNSSSKYRGRQVDVQRIGRDLDVRYIVQGTVRRNARQLRITAQLVDTEKGSTRWADRIESDVDDLFDLQDRVAERLVAAIEPSVQRLEIERARRCRPNNLRAYYLYLRALPRAATQMPQDARDAMAYLQQALQIDPRFAAAHALLAWCYEWRFTREGFSPEDRAEALRHARSALGSDNDDATALAIAGFVVTMLSPDHQAGLDANRRAIALNPSCATAMYLGAVTSAFAGDAEAAIRLADRAYRLSPYDPLVYQAELARGVAAIARDEPRQAAIHLDIAVQVNPALSSLYFTGASAHALAGHRERARELAEQGLKLEPTFRLRLFAELMVQPLARKLAEGARLAGLSD